MYGAAMPRHAEVTSPHEPNSSRRQHTTLSQMLRPASPPRDPPGARGVLATLAVAPDVPGVGEASVGVVWPSVKLMGPVRLLKSIETCSFGLKIRQLPPGTTGPSSRQSRSTR